MSTHRLALTAGEPAGIGPDLCIQLAQRPQQCQIVVIADPTLLSQRAAQLGLPVRLIEVDLDQAVRPAPAGSLNYLPVPLAVEAECGELDSANACYVLDTLQIALDGCLDGRFDAVVTAPV